MMVPVDVVCINASDPFPRAVLLHCPRVFRSGTPSILARFSGFIYISAPLYCPAPYIKKALRAADSNRNKALCVYGLFIHPHISHTQSPTHFPFLFRGSPNRRAHMTRCRQGPLVDPGTGTRPRNVTAGSWGISDSYSSGKALDTTSDDTCRRTQAGCYA